MSGNQKWIWKGNTTLNSLFWYTSSKSVALIWVFQNTICPIHFHFFVLSNLHDKKKFSARAAAQYHLPVSKGRLWAAHWVFLVVFVNRSQKNRVLVYSNGPLILSPRFPSIPRHVDEQSHRARSAPTQICSSKVRSTSVFYSQRASSELERSCDRLRKLAKTPATSPASRARDKDWFSSRNTPKMTPQPAPDVQTGAEEGDKSRSASSEPCPVPMFPCSQSRFSNRFSYSSIVQGPLA